MTILEAPSETAPPPPRPPTQPPMDARSRRSGPRPPRRRRLRAIAFLLVLLMLPVGWSYGGYLTAPGAAPVSVRTVDWLRANGFSSAVNRFEQWWYTRNKPTGTRPSNRDLPATAQSGSTVALTVRSTHHPLLPDEGIWHNVVGLATTPGAVQQTYTRPDRRFPSVVADLVRMNQKATRLVYVPGTKEPGGSGWAWHSEIPPNQRPHVVAAFNAGFKFHDFKGGAYTEGRHVVRPLANGLASVIIHRNGTADVARWGGDATVGRDVVSVRQNLALIVDGGKPAAGLLSDRGGQWGTKKSQLQFTWRSALGVDAHHRLIYAAGRKMSLSALATAMADAGAVRAMQLDIHDKVVTFNWYRPNPKAPLGVDGSKLMASMQRGTNRFLAPDQRDFLAVAAR